MLDLIRGLHLPPAVVGLARGFVEAVLMGALGGATLWLGEAEDLIVVAPLGYFVIRWLESLVDQIDPEKVRSP
jgi:hypothetical protein